MRYRLRTLLIVLAVGPVVVAIGYREAIRRWQDHQFYMKDRTFFGERKKSGEPVSELRTD